MINTSVTCTWVIHNAKCCYPFINPYFQTCISIQPHCDTMLLLHSSVFVYSIPRLIRNLPKLCCLSRADMVIWYHTPTTIWNCAAPSNFSFNWTSQVPLLISQPCIMTHVEFGEVLVMMLPLVINRWVFSLHLVQSDHLKRRG